MRSCLEFKFFSEEEKLQLLDGSCPRQFRTFWVIIFLRLKHPYSIQCLDILSRLKLGQTNLKLREKSEVNGQEARNNIVHSCFDPKASFSRLLKLTPWTRELNCNNSHCYIAGVFPATARPFIG